MNWVKRFTPTHTVAYWRPDGQFGLNLRKIIQHTSRSPSSEWMQLPNAVQKKHLPQRTQQSGATWPLNNYTPSSRLWPTGGFPFIVSGGLTETFCAQTVPKQTNWHTARKRKKSNKENRKTGCNLCNKRYFFLLETELMIWRHTCFFCGFHSYFFLLIFFLFNIFVFICMLISSHFLVRLTGLLSHEALLLLCHLCHSFISDQILLLVPKPLSRVVVHALDSYLSSCMFLNLFFLSDLSWRLSLTPFCIWGLCRTHIVDKFYHLNKTSIQL